MHVETVSAVPGLGQLTLLSCKRWYHECENSEEEQMVHTVIRACLSCVFIVAIMSLGARADVSIPDTPAGRTLRTFLDAFNSGEHYGQLLVYYRANNLVPPDPRR